ncbi:MAG TPA: hypothetical protein VEH51_04340 [Burkholderiales bacterium]|nr:hypothetical protein [Burkholderiales bacterium]
MLHIDIGTWRRDAGMDLRVHAAARRARTELIYRLLARIGARPGRRMRVPASRSAHVQGRVARG